MVANADVASLESMQGVVKRAYERFGALHGVIHAAGATAQDSFRSIQGISHTACERQFQPKAHGLYVLQSVLDGQELDFCLLMSSLASILGGLGFVAYAAANQFMDTLAVQLNRTEATRWLSVNWDGWRMRTAPETRHALGSRQMELALVPREGAEAFRRILSMERIPQVIVSTADLRTRVVQWVELGSPQADDLAAAEPTPSAHHARSDLPGDYVAPRDETEKTIARLWETLLGVKPVGIYDNFFELGGHSLLAIQLISRLHDACQAELSVQALFDAPTVAELAETVEKTRQTGHVEDDLERLVQLLDVVEQLSDDEIKALLADTDEAPSGEISDG
jgi:acyl carrier protein